MVGKVNLDFFIITEFNPKLIFVADASTWFNIEKKPAIIEITLPGGTTPIVFNYLKNGINIFNSNNLKITKVLIDCKDQEYQDLPDGIYKFVLKGSPDSYFKEKYLLKTDSLQLRIDKILINLGFNFEYSKKEEREEIKDILFTIRQAEAFLRAGDLEFAKEFFEIAIDEVEKLENCLE